MPVAELDIPAPRLRGRPPKVVEVALVRELVEADLSLLASERGVQAPTVTRLRDRHHALAKCLANGMSPAEASGITGYSISRISILRSDPSFRELLSHYETVRDAAFAEYQTRAALVSTMALDVIADRIEDEPESITTGMALEIATKLGDRTGHAPVTKQVNLNATVDLGGRLAAARARLAQRSSPAPTTIPPPDEAN